MTTVTLHIIAKDEFEKVEWIIGKYQQYFDEVHIAVDERVEDFKKLGSDKVSIFPYEQSKEEKEFGGIFFDNKRNFLASKCQTDYYFRLDTDDEIVNPEKIKEVADIANREQISIITTYYDYSKDEWGNTNAAHYRETIIENTPHLYWNKHIHENVLPKEGYNFIIVRDDSLHIKHNIDKAHSTESVKRNFKYLVQEWNKDRDKTDPRTLAYLGRSCMGIGEFEKAVFFLEQHIHKSGWDEDRYLSWCQLSHIFRIGGDHTRSLASAFEAIQEVPDYPDAYFEIHDTYFQQEKWEKAIEWAVMGFSKPIPKTNMLINPSNYTWRPMLSLAGCYYMIGEFEKAWDLFQRVEKCVPTFEYIVKEKKNFENALYHDKYVKHLTWLLAYTKDKNPDGVVDLVKSIPTELHQHDAVAKARNSFLPPKVWSDKSVVIYCGTTWEPWSPNIVKTGIGGSEEAAIHLSKELVKLGYEVTVFNDCGADEGIYDGVEYRNFVRFSPKDDYNILVSWRANIFQFGIEAKNKIIWVHDLPLNLSLNKETINTFDKIIVLSQYHASLLPDCVPKEKIFVSTNGINPEDFVGIKEERIPHRIIYASSYNRGLETILDMWKDIKKEVPDAEIHCYYGWNTYDRAVTSGDVQDKGWKSQMTAKLSQEGVFEHGRIGHKELLKEYAKAGVFAYPCEYSGEINCIALTKAIACGCACVTNDAYVMKERNPLAVSDDKFKETLIDVLKNGTTVPLDRTQYIQDNSWETVARSWHTDVFPIDVPTKVQSRIDWMFDNLHKKSKIVEIGCANGQMLKDYPNVTRVDIDDWKNIPNFVNANAEELPFKDKEFDIAVLGEILEHVKNPQKALSEAIRVSKRVIITVPLEYEWHHPYLLPFDTIEKEEEDTGKKREEIYKDSKDVTFYKKDNYEHLRHQRYYTYESFSEELEKTGKPFSVIKLRKAGLSHLGGILENTLDG